MNNDVTSDDWLLNIYNPAETVYNGIEVTGKKFSAFVMAAL
jgi:hypothetical protein